MALLDAPSAGSAEREFDGAWTQLSRALPGSGVRLTVQHRVTNCAGDVLALVDICRNFLLQLDYKARPTARRVPWFGAWRPMRGLPLVLLTLLLPACASECDDAKDKLDSCSDEIGRAAAGRGYLALPLTVTDDCSGQNLCISKCLNDADCTAIAYVVAGTPTDPNGPPAGAPTFSKCLTACMER